MRRRGRRGVTGWMDRHGVRRRRLGRGVGPGRPAAQRRTDPEKYRQSPDPADVPRSAHADTVTADVPQSGHQGTRQARLRRRAANGETSTDTSITLCSESV